MDRTKLIERLKLAAEGASDIQRRMAEAKSLRQEGNAEGRTDLYMWPTPEQTLEGQAAALLQSDADKDKRIERLREALDKLFVQAIQSDMNDPADEQGCAAIALARQALQESRNATG